MKAGTEAGRRQEGREAEREAGMKAGEKGGSSWGAEALDDGFNSGQLPLHNDQPGRPAVKSQGRIVFFLSKKLNTLRNFASNNLN